MSLRKRVLVFPFGLLAHYLRCIVLATDYYGKADYDFLFIDNPLYNRFVTGHGFKTFSCDQFDADYVMQCASGFSFSWLNKTDIERVMLSQLRAIEQYKPAFVVGDVAPGLKMAAEIARVPYVSLMNGYMTRYYSQVRQLPRASKLHRYLSLLPVGSVKYLTPCGENLAFRYIHLPFRYLRKKYKLRRISGYLEEMEGDDNLVCDDAALFPQRNLPGNYHFTGPLLYYSPKDESSWLQNTDLKKPVIVICMGSSGHWQKLGFLNNKRFHKYTLITAGDSEGVLYRV